jgi:hypothetical protein
MEIRRLASGAREALKYLISQVVGEERLIGRICRLGACMTTDVH